MCNKCNTRTSTSTNRKDFFITTDSDGKMPRLERTRVPSTPYYTQYINDKPVLVAPHFSQDRVWDYATSQFLSLHPSTKRYDGTPMPVYKGRVLSE